MNVIFSDARSSLPYELLYADDLVLMAPAMTQLGSRVTVVNFLNERLNVENNSSSSGKVIVNCNVVCGKGVHANFVKCITCKKVDSQVV